MKKSKNNRDQLSTDKIFKQCPACGTIWTDREAMLADREVCIIGYQTHFKELTNGLFLFNHSCNGTFSIQAGEFADMYKGPVFKEHLAGTEDCPGYCLHKKNLESCPLKCECAYIREIIQLLKK